ncbi:HAD family hydrolase [Streptomyces sp. NPDC058231]|uniref:HAD family hydrolase n=1 Tax=Streptomyces sp. NPDC058231 TaxID=3346392 RepID=UPI0036E4FD7B
MPLLMLDLDNTLVDRDAAFREAVAAFLAEYALPASDLDWLMSIDRSGHSPRRVLAEAMADRYGARVPRSDLAAMLQRGGADHMVLQESTQEALCRAMTDGWTCVVVTNGPTAQQKAKLRNCGLDALVHGWVISEEVGHRKPEREIFEAAAEAVGASLQGAWMVGDSPSADIGGAVGLGVRSVWVSGGRPWPPEMSCQPSHVSHDVAAAINHVIRADAAVPRA